MTLLILFAGGAIQAPFSPEVYTLNAYVNITPAENMKANPTPANNMKANPTPAKDVKHG